MSISDNNRIEPRLLKGFRDHLPHKQLQRLNLIQSISQTLTNFGFLPLETPALEYAEILEGKLGDEGEKLLYKFKDHGDRQVAMRYDFTVPLARVVAQYPELPKPFKRYQVGPVWRADNTQRGRFREFYQFDMDIVGTDSTLSDAEILVLMQEILLSLGVEDFTIKINDRESMALVVREYKLDAEQQKVFLTGLDKHDKVGEAGVVSYWKEHGLTVLNDDFIKKIEAIVDRDREKSRLSQIIAEAEKLGLQKDFYKIDPTVVRGLDYYTGTVFETVLTDAPNYGSVFSGGRYDGLVGRFAKHQVPAIGSSIGLDRLMAALEELELLPSTFTSTQVFITVFNPNLTNISLEIAQKFRQQGINTEVSYLNDNLGKQLKLAAAKHINYAAIIGPDEAENNHLVLRNLESGQEQKLTVTQAIDMLVSE